jgi:hypothetical protein
MEAAPMSILDKIVTPAFVAFQAHCWFAYAVVFTFVPAHPWVSTAAVAGAAVKEFYVDKHFEANQSFLDNLQDFAGYFVGIVLAVAARRYL